MSLWKASDIAAAVKGDVTSDWSVDGISIDSRNVNKGDLFVAIRGDNFDGHDYVAKALTNGAGAAMVAHVPEGVAENNLVVVEDSFVALENLGRAARQRLKGKVVGVTGSVGKTSTRAMLESMLSGFGKTHATKGNLNNHYGTPLTLARMPADSDFAVIEMGMNHAGEIHQLTMQAQPHVAIVTTVEAVHLEFFGTVEKIAEAKGEIFYGMSAGGIAVVNADNLYTPILRSLANEKGLEVISFGTADNADVRLISHRAGEAESEIIVTHKNNEIAFKLAHSGRHMAINASGVLAVAAALGLDIKKAAKALSTWQTEAGRGNVVEITISGGRKIRIIDDSYNASPASMKAALTMLTSRKTKGRKLAVLGDMRELGADALALHVELRSAVENSGAEAVFVAGENMANLYDVLPDKIRGGIAANAEELLPVLEASIIDGDILLVKGSHGSNMWKIVSELTGKKHAV